MTTQRNNSITSYWDFLFIELADPRTNDWFLIKSPIPGLTIIALYLYFVLSWGPRWMQDRKPFVLKNTLIIYNFFQVCVSCYLVYETFAGLWLQPGFSFKCASVDFTVNELSIRQATGVYIYFLAKITELLDTVFFVLRKKQNQITFLHLYHHTVMPLVSWGCTKYYPGGHGTFVGAINSFVHIIMYSYYMLAAFGPKMQPYLWWKKYITVLQMCQFLLVFLHQIQLLWVPCDYPLFSLYITLPNAWFFLYLFNDFYVKSYKESRAKVKDEENKLLAKLKENNATGKLNGTVLSNGSDGTDLRYRGNENAKNGHINANGHKNGFSNGGTIGNEIENAQNGHIKTNGHSNGISNGRIDENGYVTEAEKKKLKNELSSEFSVNDINRANSFNNSNSEETCHNGYIHKESKG